MFCNFCEKFENSKWSPFLVRQNFGEGQNFVEIAPSSMVFKIQNGRHFLKSGLATLQRYPVCG